MQFDLGRVIEMIEDRFGRVRRPPQRVLNHLAELRKEAVQDILNGPVSSEEDLVLWKAKDDAWWTRVAAHISPLNIYLGIW